jgi:hypothetical protein
MAYRTTSCDTSSSSRMQCPPECGSFPFTRRLDGRGGASQLPYRCKPASDSAGRRKAGHRRPAQGAAGRSSSSSRLQLADLAERVRSGRLKPIIGAIRPLAEAPSAFTPGHRIPGKTIIRATDDDNRTRASDRPADRSRATCPDRKARGGRPTGCTGPPGDAATSTARQTHQR